jgi:hypothetical protein
MWFEVVLRRPVSSMTMLMLSAWLEFMLGTMLHCKYTRQQGYNDTAFKARGVIFGVPVTSKTGP